jgi:hypothetical protein
LLEANGKPFNYSSKYRRNNPNGHGRIGWILN